MFFQMFQLAIIACIAGVIEGQCSANADITIAIPSLWDRPYAEFENGTIDLMYYLDINPGRINIGLIRYGDGVSIFATPQPFKNREQVNTRITILTKDRTVDGYGLNVSNAINAMDRLAHEPPDTMYPRGILRGNARKIGVLFIHGNSSDAPGVLESANRAKSRGMEFYVIIATGNGSYGQHVAPLIASSACHFFQVNDFATDLPYLTPLFANAICSELDPRMQGHITPDNCSPGTYQKAPLKPVTCMKKNNMVQQDPNNCAYFYKCSNYNTPPLRERCSDGTVFDPVIVNCNHAVNTACYSDLQCPQGDQLYPYPLDCERFINCDQYRIPHVQHCPKHMRFDPVWKTCNMSSYIQCDLPRFIV